MFLYFKKGKSSLFVLLLALGAVLLMLSGLSFDETAKAVETEEELYSLCSSVDGVGRCKVSVMRDTDGEVLAAAVLCEGAESVFVREKLCRLISSFYGIGYNRISVLKISE